MSDSRRADFPWRLEKLRDRIRLTDLKILAGLLEGQTKDDLSKKLGIADKTLDNRLDEMNRNGILLKEKAPIVDVLQLFNFVLGVFVKMHIAAAIPATSGGFPGSSPTPPPPPWSRILKEMRDVDPVLYDKLVRLAVPTKGTESDLFFIITTQSEEEYETLIEKFQSKGYLESVRSMTFLPIGDYRFDPVALPEPKELEAAWSRVQDSKFIDSKKK